MKRFLISFAQVIGYFLAVFIMLVLLVIPTQFLFGDLDSLQLRLEIFILGIHMVIAVAVVSGLMVLIKKSQLIKKGWPTFRLGLKWFGIGAFTGLLMSGGVLFITWISGGGSFSFNTDELSEYFPYVLPLIFFILLAALGEEWIFRGYPLSKFSQTVGPYWANILVSLLFMAGHWGGEGWSVLAATNIFLFSLVNGAMRFTSGGIPAAWGFHFVWNSFYVVCGATLTGGNFQIPFIQFLSDDPVWLSGGAYGPEGSIGTTIVTMTALVFLYRYLKDKIVIEIPSKIDESSKSDNR
jgi:membrane protease YdiL (CAAX protease family)